MSKTTLRAGTSPFAHLLSALSPRSKRAEDDEQREDARRAEEEEEDDSGDDKDARKARRAEEDERREEEDARRAEEDERRQEEDARRAEEDDEDEDHPDEDAKSKSKSKSKSKRAEDGDDEDDGEEGDEKTDAKADDMDDEECAKALSNVHGRKGFAAAQARARRIFSVPAAAKRPDLAAHLACNETMFSKQAISMLTLAADGEPASASHSRRLARRMSKVEIPNPGAGDDDGGKRSFGEIALAAAKKAGIAK